MKLLNLILLTMIILLASTTAAGALLQQPHRDSPYIPTNLEYSPMDGGGGTTWNPATNQSIPGIISNDHIDVYTTENLQSYTYKSGENVTIPLYLKYISTSESSTTITIEPQNPMSLSCIVSLGPNKGGIRINDYLSYSLRA